MAFSNPIILVLCLLPLTPLLVLSTEPKNAGNMIELGSSLSPKGNTSSSWVSSSGHFAFGFYPQGDGYAVGIWLVGGGATDNTVVWTANRDEPPLSANSTLQLTVSGLVLQQGGEENQGGLIAASLSQPVGSACMLDSGNFVIYGELGASNVVWQSFQYPTDTILGGQSSQHQTEPTFYSRTVTNGSKLVSSLSKSDHSSGRFVLIVDIFGLAAFPLNTMRLPEDAYWSIGPVYEPVSGLLRPLQLSLDLEGSLCVSKSQCMTNYTNHKKKLGNATSIFRATLDVDGNFRLYEHQFVGKGNTKSVVQKLWEALPDECQIKGFCGLNSYCSNVNGTAICACYPGYIPSQNNNNNSNNLFLDCKLNYRKDDCIISADPDMLYDVIDLEHVWWGQFPYLAMPMMMESCKKYCKEDSDCGGALYTNGSCYKYQLPLKYGKRIPNAPFTAFLKVSSSRHIISQNHTILPPVKKAKVVVENKSTLIITLVFTLGSISLICVVFAMCIFITYKHKVYRCTKLSESSNMGFIEECSLRSFSFDELEKATNGFTEEVGKGSFGAVYKGTIHESNRRIDVAVKKLEKIDEGEGEFRAEISAIARTHHRNLVKLIGFCIDGSRKLLVYEYISNGSLSNLLFKAKKHLPWKERLKIALDVARGVQYLHEQCEVRIIHCNIKPRNILMDGSWNAKISDFGFARLLRPEQSRTRPKDEGISRYLAPEWQNEALLSVKADIYSFGVVLLEIVCRRRGIEVNVSCPEEVLLSTWVYQCFEAGQLNKLVAYKEEEDEDEDVDLKTLERMVKVGLWCVQDNPSMRPSMKNVILMLEGWKDIPVPPSPPVLE